MKYFLLVALLYAVTPMYAQPAIQWQHCYGGGNSDNSYSICQTADGGYITVGSSNSVNGDVTGNHGNSDLWVVKITSTGSIQWQKSYGGTGNDLAFNVIPLPDGGYVIDAYKYSTDGDVTCSGNYWLIKINDTGALLWQKCLQITLGNRAENPSLILMPDGGFAFVTGGSEFDWTAGHGAKDFLLVRLDSYGNTLWHKCYGGSRNDYASSVKRTTDGGFIIAGYTQSNDGQVTDFHYTTSAGYQYDYWVVKTDSVGNFIWGNSLGGLHEDIAYSIFQSSDGGYTVAGYTRSNDSDVVALRGVEDYWIVKLNGSGSVLWKKCYGGTALEEARCIKQTVDGGFIVAGLTGSNDWDVSGNHGTGIDYWVVKLNDTGLIMWQKCLGGTDYESAYCIAQTSDNGFIITGNAGSNNGDVSGNHGSGDYWVVKLFPDTGATSMISNNSELGNLIVVYPNPVSDILHIDNLNQNADYKLFNVLGTCVMNGIVSPTKNTVNTKELPKGFYILKFDSEIGRAYKILKE
jgi:hypothetical protein